MGLNGIKMDNYFIEIDNVSHIYKTDQTESGVEALSEVSISIEKGSFVVILGRNGSGKSTLARLMNALLLPSEGVVLVKGINKKAYGKSGELQEWFFKIPIIK
jgi:energy-coupling factor transport system ATP-binding protein